jgi:hypothetical protein
LTFSHHDYGSTTQNPYIHWLILNKSFSQGNLTQWEPFLPKGKILILMESNIHTWYLPMVL